MRTRLSGVAILTHQQDKIMRLHHSRTQRLGHILAKLNKSRPLFVQTLESRTLMAADVFLREGVLTVRGDDRPNEITAFSNQGENRLTVVVDGQRFLFRDSLVRQIRVDARGGDDIVSIQRSIRQPSMIDGGDGDDSLSGSNQSDVIRGGAGNDRISGNGGADAIDGGLGNDGIGGGAGNDRIVGGPGSDFLRGGLGDDQIFGDLAVDSSEDLSDEASVSIERAFQLTDELRELGTRHVADAESFPQRPLSHDWNDLIYGDDGDDVLYAGLGIDVVFGGSGNDSISGGQGVDFIDGQSGNDRINGGSATDILFGGEGDDGIAGGRGDDYLIGGAGNDELDGGVGNDWLFGDATNSYVPGIYDPVVFARLYMEENRGEDSLAGGDGDDIMLGGNGNDRMSGGKGDDFLMGGAGMDFIAGGEGADKIHAVDGEVDVIQADIFDRVYMDEFDRLVS